MAVTDVHTTRLFNMLSHNDVGKVLTAGGSRVFFSYNKETRGFHLLSGVRTLKQKFNLGLGYYIFIAGDVDGETLKKGFGTRRVIFIFRSFRVGTHYHYVLQDRCGTLTRHEYRYISRKSLYTFCDIRAATCTFDVPV